MGAEVEVIRRQSADLSVTEAVDCRANLCLVELLSTLKQGL
jgi:hypothetical protein